MHQPATLAGICSITHALWQQYSCGTTAGPCTVCGATSCTQVDNPSWQLHWLLSCKAHHPTWSEMVWSEADILGLISEEYPWFLSTYQTYSGHVFRSDLARFVILHRHGGVYLDAGETISLHYITVHYSIHSYIVIRAYYAQRMGIL